MLVAASWRCPSGDFGCCGRSLIVSKVRSFGLFARRLRTGGLPNLASSGLGYIWRGSWYNSHGVPVTTVCQ